MHADHNWNVVKILPTDYKNYGGTVERWIDDKQSYPDCSWGCRWWISIYDNQNNGPDFNWGVCINLNSPRCGLLTWEHQAGFNCFEEIKEEDDDSTG